jgi:DNA-binding XRE family transcriptional regulator
MSNISQNIKFLRKKWSLTQTQFAEKIGVKRPIIGAYEEGRAEPKLTTLQTIATTFEVSIDALVSKELERFSEEDWKDKAADVRGQRLRVLAFTVDSEDKENVEIVPQKAAAGYTNGYADAEYLQELPKLHLPMLSTGTHRAFEIQGDSMLPVQPGSIIVGNFVEDWHNIKSGKTYVIVTENEGIVYKRVHNRIFENGTLLLISDNKAYDSYEVSTEDVIEVWEASYYMSAHIPEPEKASGAEASASDSSELSQLTQLVQELQKDVKELKSGK